MEQKFKIVEKKNQEKLARLQDHSPKDIAYILRENLVKKTDT